jgi:hypothetical protein
MLQKYNTFNINNFQECCDIVLKKMDLKAYTDELHRYYIKNDNYSYDQYACQVLVNDVDKVFNVKNVVFKEEG